VKLAAIQRPAECVWVGDSGCVNLGPNDRYPSEGTTCPGVDGRHNEGANFGYCDGHGKWHKWVPTAGLPFANWNRT
jgi:prepilin-type processing-associated H-X9-DG protein